MADTYKTLTSVDTVTDISDTDYVIVNDSDAVKQITKANLLDELTTTVSENASNITTNASDISDLDTRVTTLEGGTITTDTTLSVSGMAADAKTVGDELNKINSNLENGYTSTDNLYSNNEDEWEQGDKSTSGALYCSIMTQVFTAEDKTIYVWQKSLMDFNANLYLYVYDANMTYLGERNATNNTAKNWNLLSIFSDAAYFKIAIHSNVGTNYISPFDASCKFMAYVGYTEVTDEESFYQKYIDKYAYYAMVEREKVANDFIEKVGEFDKSSNMWSEYASDWSQGVDSTEMYRSKMDSTNTILDGFLFIIFDASTIPDDFPSAGRLALRMLTDDDSFVANYSVSLSGIKIVDIKNSYTSATKFKVTLTSGVGSYYVTPEVASSIKAYIGYKPIGSYVTTTTPSPFFERNIVGLSRDVMDGGYLPDYWLEYLHDKAVSIATIDESIGGHGFSFAFFTDQHWDSNFQKSPMILKWLHEHTNVDRFIGGGDILTNYSSIENAMRWLRDFNTKCNGLKVRNVRGNHDNNSVGTSSSVYIGDDRFYSGAIRGCENDVTIEDGHLYYYETIESQKVVIFYLDTGDMQNADLIDYDAQITWMDSIVQTLDSSWSILVVQHIIFDGTDDNDVPTLYSLGTTLKNYLDTVTNCTVIGAIGGHIHDDYSLVTDNGYPLIVTTCDASLGTVATYRTEGTTTEQSIDVFHIDTTNRTINATRIGYGSDRSWTY